MYEKVFAPCCAQQMKGERSSQFAVFYWGYYHIQPNTASLEDSNSCIAVLQAYLLVHIDDIVGDSVRLLSPEEMWIRCFTLAINLQVSNLLAKNN